MMLVNDGCDNVMECNSSGEFNGIGMHVLKYKKTSVSLHVLSNLKLTLMIHRISMEASVTVCMTGCNRTSSGSSNPKLKNDMDACAAKVSRRSCK